MNDSRRDPTETVAVLLDADFAFGSRLLDGVRSFARRSTHWRLLPLHSTQDALLEALLREHRLSGVIGSFLSDRWLASMADGTLPFVNVGNASEIHTVPSVVTDERAVGRLAARHLCERGWTRLGAVFDPASHAARQRFEGFREAAGLPVSTPPRGTGYATDATWPDWLAQFQRPFAVFCTSDFLARRVATCLKSLHLAVPEEAALVGVGDSVLDSVLAGQPLTSVALPAERIGERAAERLWRRIRGMPDAETPDRIAPVRLEVRESSSLFLGHSALVSRALAVLDAHMREPLDIGQLATRCGASRRTLEMRFRDELGQPPAEVLRNRRHAKACHLLRETDLPLAEVALSVGFREPARFWTVFKAREGLTPGDYRRNVRPTLP